MVAVILDTPNCRWMNRTRLYGCKEMVNQILAVELVILPNQVLHREHRALNRLDRLDARSRVAPTSRFRMRGLESLGGELSQEPPHHTRLSFARRPPYLRNRHMLYTLAKPV